MLKKLNLVWNIVVSLFLIAIAAFLYFKSGILLKNVDEELIGFLMGMFFALGFGNLIWITLKSKKTK